MEIKVVNPGSKSTKKQEIAFYYKKNLKVIKMHDSVTQYDEKHYKNAIKSK